MGNEKENPSLMGAFDLPEIILTIFIIIIIAVAVYFIVKKVKKSRNSDSYTPGSDKNEESENFNEGQIISQSYDGTYNANNNNNLISKTPSGGEVYKPNEQSGVKEL